MCLGQGHNVVTPTVRLEPTAPRSRVKHFSIEPVRSLPICLRVSCLGGIQNIALKFAVYYNLFTRSEPRGRALIFSYIRRLGDFFRVQNF